jgi:hypothetical protein
MHKKPPVIDGRIPDIKQELEKIPELAGSSESPNPKIADEYDHYPDCRWAIVEYKSMSIKDAVSQLADTAEKLSNTSKPLDFAFIVSKKMNHSESRIFAKKGNLLHTKLDKSPVRVRHGSNRVDVHLYYHEEIERQYEKYEGSLPRWVST